MKLEGSTLLLVAFAAFALAAECRQRPTPPPMPPADAGADASPEAPETGPADAQAPDSGAIDPRPDDEPGERCERGYEAARRLGCPPKAPRTGTWVEACRNAESRGIDMQPDCAERALTCKDVARCFSESPD